MSLVYKVIHPNTQDLLKRTHLQVPVILIGHAGNVLNIGGAIFTDTVYVDTLLTMNLLLGHFPDQKILHFARVTSAVATAKAGLPNTTRTYQTISTSLSIFSSLILTLLVSMVRAYHKDPLGKSANMGCLGEIFCREDVRYEDRWFAKFQSQTRKNEFRVDEMVLGRDRARAK